MDMEYTRPDGETYDERSREIIEEYKESLLSGQRFIRVMFSSKSVLGYQPPINRTQWSEMMQGVSKMARESDALAQIASTIMGRVNLYGSAHDAKANIYEGAWIAVNRGYDDVILRSGPEAPRYSDCQRSYKLTELIRADILLTYATDCVADTAPGLGWCLEALARAYGVRTTG